MLSFKKITLDEREMLEHYLPYHKERSCDFTVGVVLMWKDFYSIEYALDDDTLFMKYTSPSGNIVFTFPQGENSIVGLDKINAYCTENGIPTAFCFITENDLEIIKNHFDSVEATDERAWADYFYDAHALMDLVGKKYSNQRNHINKFLRNYKNYSFEQITKETKHEAQAFWAKMYNTFRKNSIYAQEDSQITRKVINNCADYSMFGAMLKVDNKVIGMSYGEILNDTLFIHIEKANTEYLGAYQMLVNMFAKEFVSENIKYINREDDSGDEGLRKSKLSYNPIKLIDKYNVKIIK